MDAKPWNADLLDWLASDFAEHEFDLQHLLRQIMTSRAYQMPVAADPPARTYVFRGPSLAPRSRPSSSRTPSPRSPATGASTAADAPKPASYTREWRLKSDPLSRALGRPIRDQVYTERSTEPPLSRRWS